MTTSTVTPSSQAKKLIQVRLSPADELKIESFAEKLGTNNLGQLVMTAFRIADEFLAIHREKGKIIIEYPEGNRTVELRLAF